MNINTKINMLYEFIYLKSKDKDIADTETDVFDIDTSISIDDIKIKFEGESYDEILDELFSGKFKMINFDEDTNNLILKKYDESSSIALYISPYNIDTDLEDLNNMNNNDCLFSYILSTLILARKTRHIALPIINIDVKIAQMHDIIGQYDDVYAKYMEMIQNNHASNILSIRVKESFFKSMQLSEFINSSECNIKKLLFQIVHTLAVLQKEFPGFRHNMLNLSNIFVYLKKNENELYEFNGKKYYIPDNNFEIKITNFFASNIPGKYGSNIDGKLMVPFFDDKNKYFDLHYFLNNFLKHYEGKLDEDTMEFMDNAIPEKYRDSKRLYLKENDEVIVPEELLKNSYFREFKNELPIQRNLMSPDNYYTNRYNKKTSHKKKSNRKTSEKKKSTRKLSVSGNRPIMKGGATFYHPPNVKQPNNPFISNDNRRVYNQNKEDKPAPKPKPQDDIIMEQTVRKNPLYKKPIFIKEKKTWEDDYKPLPKETYVPKVQAHYPSETQSPKPSEKSEQSEESDESDYSNSNDETIESSISDKPINSDTSTRHDTRPRRDTREKHNYKPYRDNDTSPRHDTRPPRDNSPPRNNYSHDNNNRPSRDNSPPRYNRDNEYPQRPKYQPNITEQPYITEQKIYPQTGYNLPPGTLHTHPKYSNPAFIPIDNQITYPPAFVPDLANYFPFNGIPLNKPNELPLQKVYNINLGAPGHNNTLLNRIYQEVLPGEPNVYTMNTIYEREQIISMLRNSIVKYHDGEDMTLQAGDNSIMEYIKILDFNPYALGRNKYKTIPINFLLYTAAYPIRYNLDNRNIEIAKQAIGMNVRIYMLSRGALNTNITAELESDNFDVWRELKYYKYIKETILKNKISPNFITLFLYKFDRVSKINYDELKEIIRIHRNNDDILRNLNNIQQINKFIESQSQEIKKTISQIVGSSSEKTIDLTEDSKVSLLCLTEAPTFNFIEWGSPTYEKNGVISKQLSTGFHPCEVWRSVLFQLVSAMAVLEQKKIYFKNFSLENNVFVKDLYKDPNNIGHWVYKVNNIDMYVPNYGHLVLIDTRFADVDPTTGTTGVFKITSPSLFKNNGTNALVNIIDDLKRILEPTNFTTGLCNNYGMVQPDYDTMALLEKITTSNKSRITDILIECFPEYIHNRVGTLLTIAEKTIISPTTQPKLIPGKLVAYQSRYDEYMWAIYVNDVIGGKKKKIYTKENNILIEKEVFNHSLVDHPDSNNIIQISEKTFRLNKDSLIDSYNINA